MASHLLHLLSWHYLQSSCLWKDQIGTLLPYTEEGGSWIKRWLLSAQRSLSFALSLRESFIHALVTEEDAVQSLGYGIIHFAGVWTPKRHTGVRQKPARRDRLIVWIDDQIGLIRMCTVGKPGFYDVTLVFLSGEIDGKCRS